MRTWLNKIMLIGIAAIAFSSCEKDEVKTVLNVGSAPTLSATPTTVVLLQSNANNDAVKFTYTTNANFGFDAAVTYVLQISKGGTNFASASTTEVGLSKTPPLEKTFKVVEFNRELLKIITYGVATPVEVRVKASVASAAPAIYSNVVTMTCTAYRDLIIYTYPDAMNIAGNFQGWSPGSAPQIVKKNNGGYTNASNEPQYEGYIVFNASTPEFKMVRGNDWVGDFGSAGGNNLRDGGPNLTLPSGGAGIAGYWRIRADIAGLTATPPGRWSWDKIDRWGIIGEFNNWSSPDVAMTFNAATGVWSITRDMPAGKFKFRANNDWGINFGDKAPADFKPEYNGDDISITAAGNYTISLDLGSGGNYAYTLKKN